MWLLLCRETVSIFGFWAVLHCLLLFLSGSHSSMLAQQPRLHCPTWAVQVPVLRWEAVPRGLWVGAWGSGEGSQGGGEGPEAELRAQPCSSGMVLRDGDGRWQMPGIAGVFLALSFVREGTRNISCPGRHRG